MTTTTSQSTFLGHSPRRYVRRQRSMPLKRDLRDKAKMTREDGVFTLKLDEGVSHALLVSFAEDMFPGVSTEDIGVWPAEEGELVVPRRRRSCAELTKRHALYRVCWNRSPRSLFAARHSAHFTLIQSHFPERYGASFFFETMPSRPRLGGRTVRRTAGCA
jgi:hypothetical protein